MSSNALDRIIGERLLELRIAAGLSLNGLAIRMEVTPSAMAAIESGDSRASAAQLHAFCEIVGCAPKQIYAPFKEVRHGEEVVGAKGADLGESPLPKGRLHGVDPLRGGEKESRVIAFPSGPKRGSRV